MKIDILTIFPGMFQGPFQESLLKKAQDKGILELNTVDIRDFATDKHKKVDDYPYGGGVGMVMKPEPIFAAWEAVTADQEVKSRKTILLCPQGEVFTQKKAEELAHCEHLILICGHYEGVDERVRQFLVDEEISIGDYILTGGEIPAMVLVDAVSRLIPGVVGTYSSVEQDTFSDGLLEYPQYTRPREFRGHKVPDVLLSGNHEEIRKWRRQESLLRTKRRRPDLLEKACLTEEDLKILNQDL